MPTLVSHPDEVKVLSKRFGLGAADIDKYIELDGYKATQKAIAEGPEWIINTMKASGLRGRGGAGFPTGMKWSFVPKVSEKPKYVLVNGDESEPGTYEVGEESALMESLEGKRGIPRIKPPFPAVVGLYGGPTVINNAETIANAPHILLMGGEAYAKLGSERNGGTRLFGLSGHVERPGVYELPMGYNLKKIIYEVGGGIPNGRSLKAVVPGGSSCPSLLPNEIDIGMDFDQVSK